MTVSLRASAFQSWWASWLVQQFGSAVGAGSGCPGAEAGVAVPVTVRRVARESFGVNGSLTHDPGREPGGRSPRRPVGPVNGWLIHGAVPETIGSSFDGTVKMSSNDYLRRITSW
jgi:hypothetical protein